MQQLVGQLTGRSWGPTYESFLCCMQHSIFQRHMCEHMGFNSLDGSGVTHSQRRSMPDMSRVQVQIRH